MLENTEGVIKKNPDNPEKLVKYGYTRHRTNKC